MDAMAYASLNVTLAHDNVEAGVPLPPRPALPPLLLLFGNSQMKNMAASHSTGPHVPVLSSSTQLEFVVGDNVEFSSSSGPQAANPCRGLESA